LATPQVKKSQTTATIEVTFAVNSPYQISYIDTSTPGLLPGLPPLPQLLWAPYVPDKYR
jgi:hypothetical protein